VAIPSYRSALALVAHDDRRRLAPAHADAGGKLLLAYRDAWRESVLERPLEPLTRATVVDADELRAECGRIRHEQIAFEREERREGRFAMAAPVHGSDGNVPAALVLTAGHPFVPDDPRQAPLTEAATELSELLRTAA
jgi:DNA-binding IclR family transcriptional regulator